MLLLPPKGMLEPSGPMEEKRKKTPGATSLTAANFSFGGASAARAGPEACEGGRAGEQAQRTERIDGTPGGRRNIQRPGELPTLYARSRDAASGWAGTMGRYQPRSWGPPNPPAGSAVLGA